MEFGVHTVSEVTKGIEGRTMFFFPDLKHQTMFSLVGHEMRSVQ